MRLLLTIYNKYPAATTALLAFLVVLCATIPTYITHGAYCLSDDYYNQYLPFLIETRHMIEGGDLWWSWNSGFGSNFIATYSYYTLFNPFSMLVLLFPAHLIVHAMYWVMLLKFAVGAYIAFRYLRLFVDNRLASLGSFLYIFSSFTISITVYYNFLDAMVLFPLMLIAIERYMMQGKRDYGFIAFSFFINAVAHYYLFVGSLIGVMMYCGVRIFSRDWRVHRTLSRCLYTAIMAVLGTAMAAFVFLPALFSISDGLRGFNPVASGTITLFQRLLSLFFPFDAWDPSLIPWSGFIDPSCYLPVISIAAVLAYICKQPRSWLSVLVIILVLCIATPYLSGIFNLYSQPQYSRWAYMLALMLSLASVIYIKEYGSHTKLLKINALITTAIVVVSIVAIMGLMFLYKNELLPASLQGWCSAIIKDADYPTRTINGRNIIIITLSLQLLSLIYFFNKRLQLRHLFAMVAVAFVIIFGNYSYIYCIERAPITIPAQGEQVSHTMHHRYAISSYEMMNTGLCQSKPAVRFYHSILNHNHSELYALCPSMIFSQINTRNDAFYTFASVKYNYDKREQGVSITPYNNYIPMGYTYDSYLPLSEAHKWVQANDSANIYHLMLATLLVQDSDTAHLPPSLSRYTIPHTLPQVATLSQERNRVTCHKFEGTQRGFSAQITLSHPDIVFFSIPCDKGFTITLNGNEVTPLKVNAGFMGIRCDAGLNTISAVYRTPYLKEGVWLSVVALVATLLIVVGNILCSKRRK